MKMQSPFILEVMPVVLKQLMEKPDFGRHKWDGYGRFAFSNFIFVIKYGIKVQLIVTK